MVLERLVWILEVPEAESWCIIINDIYSYTIFERVFMGSTVALDNMVPVTFLDHGGASKTLNKVGDGNPVIVLKNNRPSAVIITPDDYKHLMQVEEDFALYREAMERLQQDDGTRLTGEEVFGKGYEPVDDGYEPEFE